MVVDDICEVIGRQIIDALVEHFIIKDITLDSHSAAQQVVDLDVASGLDTEAHHILCAAVDESLHFLGRHGERVAHAHACRGVILEIGDFLALCVELLGGIESDICLTCVEKHFHVLAVDIATLALLVGAVRAAFAHAFVYFNTEPCERLIDIIFGSRHKTLGVGVFYSKNHLAAMLTGKKIVI